MGSCNGNRAVLNFGLQIIMNEKITGEAARSIRAIEDNPTWSRIKCTLMEHFRPITTYGEVFNKARMVNVSCLKELFTAFIDFKHEINEIYLFDNRKSHLYRPENVTRDLVEIIIKKRGHVRIHIGENDI